MRFLLIFLVFFSIFPISYQFDLAGEIEEGFAAFLKSFGSIVNTLEGELKKGVTTVQDLVCPRLTVRIFFGPETMNDPLQLALTEMVMSIRALWAKWFCTGWTNSDS